MQRVTSNVIATQSFLRSFGTAQTDRAENFHRNKFVIATVQNRAATLADSKDSKGITDRVDLVHYATGEPSRTR